MRKTADKKAHARKGHARKAARKVPARKIPAPPPPALETPQATPQVTPPAPHLEMVTFSDGGGGSAAPDPVSSPDLLDFQVCGRQWADLSDDDKRDAVVTLLQQTVNFGVADKPAGRHAAYGDIIAPGEASAMRQGLLQKTTANSSCGLLIRSAWRFLGAKDPLLDPPYRPGSVITNILKYATQNGAMNKLTPDEFDPHPGDVLYVVAPGHQHILTVTEVDDDGTTIRSIDGGQISKKVDDGGCNSIQARERKLDKQTLTFDDGKKIANWIDVTKLPFSEPMVDLTKKMNDDDVA